MYRLFSILLDRRASLVGFGMFMMPIQVAAMLKDDPSMGDQRLWLGLALYCLLWVLIYRALRGSRLATAGVGAYMALQGLLYVLMLLGNLVALLTGSVDMLANFVVGAFLGPWFLVAGSGLMGKAWISHRIRQPLPDAAHIVLPD